MHPMLASSRGRDQPATVEKATAEENTPSAVKHCVGNAGRFPV
jgi:hypothetical protein